MGEVQTDSPALVKVRAATYTSQIPARALMGPGFRACPEKLAVREIAVSGALLLARVAFSGCQHQWKCDRCDPTLCSGSCSVCFWNDMHAGTAGKSFTDVCKIAAKYTS